MKCYQHDREDCNSDLCEHEYFVALRPHNPKAHAPVADRGALSLDERREVDRRNREVDMSFARAQAVLRPDGTIVRGACDEPPLPNCRCVAIDETAPPPFTLAEDPVLAAYTRAVERRVLRGFTERYPTKTQVEAEIKRVYPFRVNEDSALTHEDISKMASAMFALFSGSRP